MKTVSARKTVDAPEDRPSFGEWLSQIKKAPMSEHVKQKLNEMAELRSMGAYVGLFTSNNQLDEKDIHRAFFGKGA